MPAHHNSSTYASHGGKESFGVDFVSLHVLLAPSYFIQAIVIFTAEFGRATLGYSQSSRSVRAFADHEIVLNDNGHGARQVARSVYKLSK